MKTLRSIGVVLTLVAPLVSLGQQRAPQGPPAAPCDPAGKEYVCGQAAPEDLVVVPGGEWVVASSFAGSGGIKVINTKDRTTIAGYPSATSKDEFDSKTYNACPGAPDANEKARFTTHGLALRPGRNSVHTLYAVHHGGRESIEVFQLDARAKPPALTWIGCVVAPDPIGLNSIVPLPDGGFIGTDFLARNVDAGQRGKMMAGENNGALWAWHTGKGWEKVPGSEASGANGLELSKDGKTLYVAAWGSQSFFRMSLGQTPVKRDSIPLGFRVDNIRWASDGSIYASGQGGMGTMQTSNVVKINPSTLKMQEILNRPNTPEFGASTVTVEVGKELWIGSYRGDRILRVPLPATK
jgi:hypothetical protein